MGEGAKSATLYFVPDNGTGTPLPCGFQELTLSDDCADSAEGFQPLEGYTLEIKSKHLRCHSRKRYVKLLMGRGWSRNAAKGRAQRRRQEGMAYSYAWWLECFSSGSFFS